MPVFTSKGKESKYFDVIKSAERVFTTVQKGQKTFEIIIDNAFFSSNYLRVNFSSDNKIFIITNLLNTVNATAQFISSGSMSIPYSSIFEIIKPQIRFDSINYILAQDKQIVNAQTAQLALGNQINLVLKDLLKIYSSPLETNTTNIDVSIEARGYYYLSDFDPYLLSDLDASYLFELDYRWV